MLILSASLLWQDMDQVQKLVFLYKYLMYKSNVCCRFLPFQGNPMDREHSRLKYSVSKCPTGQWGAD